MDESTVEKVARAIYENAHRNLPNCWAWDDSGLDDEHPRTRQRYLRYARAAIAAMRELTDPTEPIPPWKVEWP